jgi:DNA polymerase-3 subunit epsilon
MNYRSRFWEIVFLALGIVTMLVSSLLVVFWKQLAPLERQVMIDLLLRHALALTIFALILVTLAALLLDSLYRNYIVAVARIAEEMRTILSVNPAHRIAPFGGADLRFLVQTLNAAADRNAEMQAGMADRIRLAAAEAQREKNILAAILSELPQGVMICNPDGQILLYNRQAARLLGRPASTPGGAECVPGSDAGCFIGLGRSIFGALDRHLILHALDEVMEKIARREEGAVARFGMASGGGRLLGVETLPILEKSGALGGFILMIEEITQQLAQSRRAREIWHALSASIRQALGAICCSAGLLRQPGKERPDLPQAELLENIEGAAWEMAAAVEGVDHEVQAQMASHWPLIPLAAGDLAAHLGRKAREQLGIEIRWGEAPGDLLVGVDRYAITLALLFLLARLKQMTACIEYSGRIEVRDGLAHFTLFWQGAPLRLETLREWRAMRVAVGEESLPFTLEELLRHHEAALWSQPAGRYLERSSLRLLLPPAQMEAPETQRPATIMADERPDFFDFDLFRPTDQTIAQESRLLTELPYTVFDTETTGLDPAGGDEIVAIGAVRLVNGRLLGGEVFDQLVDPQRPVPAASVRIHGIDPAMLAGQQTVGPVLQRFAQFAAQTVLVGHNAAFDMRMLQISEGRSGIRFSNPVLDTLLLSGVVYPAHGDHSLEAIARRLGIRIVGRHTALGDAMMTGEIFLKLLPLLAHKGVFTLGEAIEASRKTYQARLKY